MEKMLTADEEKKAITAAEYVARRNAYAYPAVGLGGCLINLAHRTFLSIRSMENHHRFLLRSQDDESAVLGYLSVIYWGHYSGQDGIPRGARALGKVRLAEDGKDRHKNGKVERIRGVADIGIAVVAERIREATALVDLGKYANAMKVLFELPQLKFAFASKVCAFLLPEQCGVVDSIIADAHRQFGFEVDANGYVRNNSANASRYMTYCSFLSGQAEVLNSSGAAFMWRDLDGVLRTWRAVDIERAMY